MDIRGIGDRIRRLRLQQGLTQRDLADAVNVTSAFICDVEFNRGVPSVKRLCAIAEALHTTVSYLVGEPQASDQLGQKYTGEIREFLLQDDSLPYIMVAKYLKETYTQEEFSVLQKILLSKKFKDLIASLAQPPPEKH
jgi:transcriptional regulator with XRE-family HTH domain